MIPDPEYSDVTKTPKWRRTYEYRGIKYDIAIIGTWFVLEYPDETARIAKLAREVNEAKEFLYADTMWEKTPTSEQMFVKMVTAAKRDIDWILDDSLGDLTDQRAEVEKKFHQTAGYIEKLRAQA